MITKPTIGHEEVNAILLKDEDVKNEYDRLKPRYQMIAQIVEVQNQANIAQEELSYRIGTTRSNICRVESGKQTVSLDFLARVAKGLGKELQISLK